MNINKDLDSILKPSIEMLYEDELKILHENDSGKKPDGWNLSPKSVVSFIKGNTDLGVSRKIYGDDFLLERAVVSLIGQQGLLLVGEPGTAKSYLSELLAAAICGRSDLTIQGSAGTTEDQIKYSWNYALLLAEGPTEKSLVKSALFKAMESGSIVRFEEITRCPQEVQDTLISLMSDKHILISEMGEGKMINAKRGFNIIATANLRDRGVHEMSSALKRRFNFETIQPLQDIDQETELVEKRVGTLLEEARTEVKLNRDVIKMLVTVFQELRSGETKEGTGMQTTSSIMSTAEAVNVAFCSALDACYFGKGELGSDEIANQIQGTVFKDNKDDTKKIRYYFDTVVKERARKGREWKGLYKSAIDLWKT